MPVRAGGDYPVRATVVDSSPEAAIIASKLIVYGVVRQCVPVSNGGGKYEDSNCLKLNGGSAYERETRGDKAFLTLPTACNGPLRSALSVDSYQGGHAEATTVSKNVAGEPVGLTGCSDLLFPADYQCDSGHCGCEYVVGLDGWGACFAEGGVQPRRAG